MAQRLEIKFQRRLADFFRRRRQFGKECQPESRQRHSTREKSRRIGRRHRRTRRRLHGEGSDGLRDCAVGESHARDAAQRSVSRRDLAFVRVASQIESRADEVGIYEMTRAVFLDRDGVINRALERDAKPFPPRNLNEFEILPEVPTALKKLKAAGFLLVVATNQPDVGRGTLKQETVEQIHAHVVSQLSIDRVEVCFHSGKIENECDCRKPKPGMLLRAAKELNIDLKQSWMVGDRWRDVDCGYNAGCKTIFVNRGYAEELKYQPDFIVKNLAEA